MNHSIRLGSSGRRHMRRSGRVVTRATALLASALLTTTLVTLLAPGTAHAADGDVGYRDFQYGPGAGSGWVDPDKSPTSSKPQSKLWFAQGQWWGLLQDPATHDVHIHALDQGSQTWSDTGVVVDPREGSHADVLWDGRHLFTASHLSSGSTSRSAVQISRYSYLDGRYQRDSGFPVTVSSGGVEAAVIAEDSAGRLWVTYTQGSKVRVAVSEPGGASWGAPFVPPVDGTSVSADDISSIAAYDGQVAVVWSNQSTDAVYAATHLDGAPNTSWDVSRKVVSGPQEADDHVNIKSVEADPAGRLFVAVKTSHNDVSGSSNAPLINLLVLGVDGIWRKYVHSRVSDGLTRPIVLVDTTNRVLRIFAAGPETGGVIYMKETPLDDISFAPGKGTPFISLGTDRNINNPTSTKQPVTSTTGLVVLASDQVTGRYVHNTMPLGSAPPPPGPQAPVADFSATPTSGSAPLDVAFTDRSTGEPTSWSWSFGDGGTADIADPTHTYTSAGSYEVSLSVSNATGTDTVVRSGVVTVTDSSEPPPPTTGDYRSAVLADGPVGYWRLGDTGSTVAATAGPDGTVVGGVSSTVGALAGDADPASAFNGADGYVSVASQPQLNLTGDLSIEAWARPTTVQSGVVVQKGGASGYPVWQYRLGMTSGGLWRGTVFVGSSAFAVTAPSEASLDTWSHLVLTRSGSALDLYVDGVHVASSTGSGTLNSTSSILGIGRSGASATSYFAGDLDEVAVYDHALSPTAVAAHYSAGGGG